MATYSPDVERWRPLVAKYFPPELVDKALYVIQGESGGNPNAVGDGGAARGLFQIQDSRNFAGRPDAAYLDDPENNIKYAAQQLGAASGKWSDWGEGSTYNGQAFGALGNNPYPGDTGDYSGGGSTQLPEEFQLPFTEEEYRQKYARQQTILGQIWDPDYGTIKADADPNLVAEYNTITADLASYDNIIARGGHDFSDWLNWVNYQNQSRAVSATNAANQAARQLQINQAAEQATAQEMQDQRLRADSAINDQALFRKSSHFDAPIGFRVGQENPMPEDQVFAKKVGEISDKVGPFVPMPEMIDIGPWSGFSAQKKPIATSPDISLDKQSGPGDFYPGFETNGSMITGGGAPTGSSNAGTQFGNLFGKALARFGSGQTSIQSTPTPPRNTFNAPPGYTPQPTITPAALQSQMDTLSHFSPFTRATGESQFAQQARSVGRRTIGSLLFGGR